MARVSLDLSRRNDHSLLLPTALRTLLFLLLLALRAGDAVEDPQAGLSLSVAVCDLQSTPLCDAEPDPLALTSAVPPVPATAILLVQRALPRPPGGVLLAP